MKASEIVKQFKPDLGWGAIIGLPENHSLADIWNFGNKQQVARDLLDRHGDSILDNIRGNNMHAPISVYRGDTLGYPGIKGMVTDGHHRLMTSLSVNPDCEFTVQDDPFYAAFEKAHEKVPCTGKVDCPGCSNLEKPHY
jgi:hypothetical protein